MGGGGGVQWSSVPRETTHSPHTCVIYFLEPVKKDSVDAGLSFRWRNMREVNQKLALELPLAEQIPTQLFHFFFLLLLFLG